MLRTRNLARKTYEETVARICLPGRRREQQLDDMRHFVEILQEQAGALGRSGKSTKL
jgi:hypothetical protein